MCFYNKKELVFLDSNSFYYFCDFAGSDSNVSNVRINSSVDYDLLYKEFETIIKNKNKTLCISPSVVLEVTTHFRDKKDSLNNLINSFIVFWNKEKFKLGFQNYGPFLKAVDKNGKSILNEVLYNEKQLSDYIEDALVSKIESEVELITIFVYLIFMSYIFMLYKLNENDLDDIMIVFGKEFSEQYETTFKPKLKNTIKDEITVAYKNGTQDKFVQRSFDKYLEECSNLSLSILKAISDVSVKIKESIKMLCSSLTNGKKSYSQKIRRWYLDNARINHFPNGTGKKKKTLDFVLDTIKPAVMAKGYSEEQYCYLKYKISDFYNNGTLIEKNDTEDFWMLFLTSKGMVISFDDYVRKIIRFSNPTNADYINSLSTKNI